MNFRSRTATEMSTISLIPSGAHYMCQHVSMERGESNVDRSSSSCSKVCFVRADDWYRIQLKWVSLCGHVSLGCYFTSLSRF